jgi:hypothetical protein
MAQQVGTNTFGVAKWIVDPTLSNGTHSTIQGAITSASSGDTIAIRPGTYTENLTLKAGVTITTLATSSTALTSNGVVIVGKATATTAGTFIIDNITFQTNADFCIAVTGTLATQVLFTGCSFLGTNSTIISHTSSSASSIMGFYDCALNLSTTGIAVFASTSAGALSFRRCICNNTGLSTTASTITTGALSAYFCEWYHPVTTSSVASCDFKKSLLSTLATNVTFLTHGGSGASAVTTCDIITGTATALTITATLTCSNMTVNSSNATTIGGAGTIIYDLIQFIGTTSVCSVTTQTVRNNIISNAKFGDGTAAIPSIAFQNTTNMGFYRSGAGSIGISFAGAQFGTWTSTSLSGATTGQYALAYSAAADTTPTYTFTADTNTGMYRSAADTLKLVTNGAAAISISSAGEVTQPLQPAFLATAALQSDVTGDGTVYTVLFATEIFDQNADFASPTFTAPVTGRYQLNATIEISGLLVAHTSANAIFVASNRSIAFGGSSGFVAATASGILRITGSVLMDMDAADTCTITTTVSGGTKVVDISATNTTFSAFLAC